MAKGFARIHWQNLVNFGVLPLTFADPADAGRLKPSDTLTIGKFADALAAGPVIGATLGSGGSTIKLKHDLSERQVALVRAGGVINSILDEQGATRH